MLTFTSSNGLLLSSFLSIFDLLCCIIHASMGIMKLGCLGYLLLSLLFSTPLVETPAFVLSSLSTHLLSLSPRTHLYRLSPPRSLLHHNSYFITRSRCKTKQHVSTRKHMCICCRKDIYWECINLKSSQPSLNKQQSTWGWVFKSIMQQTLNDHWDNNIHEFITRSTPLDVVNYWKA